MRKLMERYDDLSIKAKFISGLLVCLMLFGCACLTGLQIMNRSNQKLLYNTLKTSLAYSAKEIRGALDELEALSFNLIVDDTIQRQLAEVKEQPEDALVRSNAYKKLNTVLRNYYEQNTSIAYISLHSDVLNIDTNTAWAEKISETARENMQQMAVQADGRIKWIHLPEADNALFIARSVNRVEPYWLDNLGAVTIKIDMQKLAESCVEINRDFGESFYCLMDGDQVLYQTERFPIDREDFADLGGDGYEIIRSDSSRYFAVAGKIGGYGWNYINVISYDDMHDAMRNSILVYLLIFIAGAVIAVLFSNVVVKRLATPVSTLMQKMKEFSRDNEKVPVTECDYSSRKDELGQLHRKFDEMAGEIIQLIEKDYKNQILMKDAQLKALEAQIDPHFLYNVLQSISWSAKEIGDKQIPLMVSALGKMLRTTLSPEDEKFTIKKEMDFVENYMIIQKFRFEGQLEFQMMIPESIKGLLVPKLIVQPLVENAIRYAMEEDDEVCSIEVAGEEHEDEVIIEVKNSGSKFEPDLLSKLERKEVTPNGFGIGLLNIQKRLHLFSEDSAFLELGHEENMAVARIHIPKS